MSSSKYKSNLLFVNCSWLWNKMRLSTTLPIASTKSNGRHWAVSSAATSSCPRASNTLLSRTAETLWRNWRHQLMTRIRRLWKLPSILCKLWVKILRVLLKSAELDIVDYKFYIIRHLLLFTSLYLPYRALYYLSYLSSTLLLTKSPQQTIYWCRYNLCVHSSHMPVFNSKGRFTSLIITCSVVSYCQSLWSQLCKLIIRWIRYRWSWAGHAVGWPNALLAHLFWTPLQPESPLFSVQATYLKSLSEVYSTHCSLADVDIQAPKNEVLWNNSTHGLTVICVQGSLLYCCSPLYFKARDQSLFLGGKVLPKPR